MINVGRALNSSDQWSRWRQSSFLEGTIINPSDIIPLCSRAGTALIRISLCPSTALMMMIRERERIIRRRAYVVASSFHRDTSRSTAWLYGSIEQEQRRHQPFFLISSWAGPGRAGGVFDAYWPLWGGKNNILYYAFWARRITKGKPQEGCRRFRVSSAARAAAAGSWRKFFLFFLSLSFLTRLQWQAGSFQGGKSDLSVRNFTR